MKYFLFLFLFLQSCSTFILTKQQEYIKGKKVYEQIQPRGNYDINYADHYLIENMNDLDSCNQYLLTVYVFSEGMKNSKNLTGYTPSFINNMVDNMIWHTSIFRGNRNYHSGIRYSSKRDAKKDLKDWKRKLNCK